MPATRFSRRAALAFAFAGLLAILLAAPARAIDTSWIGYPAWEDPGAWSAGVPYSAGDIARLNPSPSGATDIIYYGSPTIGQIVLGSSGAYGIGIHSDYGTPITMDAGGGTPLIQILDSTSQVTHNIDYLNLHATSTIDVGRLATLSVSGVSSDAPGAGITKQGPGTLDMYGVNSYSGGTTIAGGTLSIAGDQCLGAGDVTLAGGAL